MFARALQSSISFTNPILISWRQHNGVCLTSIGTFVVVNEEGWCVTAFHILKQLNELGISLNNYNTILAQRQAIEANTSLNTHQKRTQLGTNKLDGNMVTNVSVWLGSDSSTLGQA